MLLSLIFLIIVLLRWSFTWFGSVYSLFLLVSLKLILALLSGIAGSISLWFVVDLIFGQGGWLISGDMREWIIVYSLAFRKLVQNLCLLPPVQNRFNLQKHIPWLLNAERVRLRHSRVNQRVCDGVRLSSHVRQKINYRGLQWDLSRTRAESKLQNHKCACYESWLCAPVWNHYIHQSVFISSNMWDRVLASRDIICSIQDNQYIYIEPARERTCTLFNLSAESASIIESSL